MKKASKLSLAILSMIIAILAFGVVISAAPCINREVQLTQPDGTKVKVLVTGDEFYQHVESIDGYTLCMDDKTGWIHYADVNADGTEFVPSGVIYQGTAKGDISIQGKSSLAKHQQISSESIRKKREHTKKLLNLDKTSTNASIASAEISGPAVLPAGQTTGNVLGLTILINFPDQQSTVSKTDITNLFNQTGYTGYGNNGSVRDYYYSVSGEKLTFTNTITGFYTAKHPKSYYNDPNIVFASRAAELVTEALQWLDSTGFNFASLTTGSDGYVLSVNALYAGEPDVAWSKGLWPHQGALYTPFRADGVNVQRYEMSNIGTDLSIYTICHENGHLIFGYPDLYDYDGDSSGIGRYSLMAYTDDKNPVPPDAYCRNVISGWNGISSLNSLADGTSVTAVSNSTGAQQAYRWTGSKANEYFLIENIRKTGRYANMPDEGLIIWHVDQNGDNSFNQMTASKHFLVSVEQADNLFQLERNGNSGADGDLFHAGYKTSFNDTTSPSAKWWNGTNSGLSISGIGAIGSSITFIKGSSGPSASRYEAEGATVNNASIYSGSDASNNQYVGGIDYSDSYVAFTVNAAAAKTYTMTIRYANGTGANSTQNLSVNSGAASTVTYTPTSGWGQFGSTTVNVTLKVGSNTIKLGKGAAGYAELDYIEIQ